MSLSAAAGGGPYSHWARERGQRNTVTLPFLNATMPSTGHLKPSAFRPTEEEGKKVLGGLRLGGKLSFLSAGAHGLAYRATNVSEASHIQFFASLSSDVIGNPQSAPQKVIIKVHRLDKFDDIAAARMECKMQAWIHSQETTFQGAKVRGSEVVPPIFYAGLLDGGEKGMVFITVMGEAPGVVLREFLTRRSNRLTGFEYALIERAILTLWLLGVVHADLHEANIFIDEKSEKVTIIDFGYALILPKARATQVRTALDQGANMNTLWNDKKTGLRMNVNAIQAGRRYDWYNPEAKAARYFRTLVAAEDKPTLSANRAKAWGQQKSASSYHSAHSSGVPVLRKGGKRVRFRETPPQVIRYKTNSSVPVMIPGRKRVSLPPRTPVPKRSPPVAGKGTRQKRQREPSKRQQELLRRLTMSRPGFATSTGGRHYVQNPKTGVWRLSPGVPRKGGRSTRQLKLNSLLTASGHSPRGRAYTKDTKGLWRLVKGPDGYAPRRKPYPFPKGVKSGFVLDRSGGKRYSYKVDIVWDGMRPMFKANDIGTVLGMTNIRATLQSYDEDEKVVKTVDSLGGMQETTYLTERGLYRLLMQSRKPAARPFQKWVVQVIETIRQKGHYDLEAAVYEAKEATRLAEAAAAQKIEELLVEQAKVSKAATDAARHTTLINAFKKGDCLVYFGKIRDEPNSKSLIKIGSTKDLKDRAVGLEREFGAMQIFEVFQVSLYRQFEEFLQGHPRIAEHVYKQPIHNGHYSNREVFKMNSEQVELAVQIAKRHQTTYNDRATTEQLVELELLRYKNSLLQSNLTGTEVKEPIPYYTPPDDRRYTQRRGDKIQRYSSDGK
ncbi:Protein kinase-like protein containing BRO family, N-terminal domain [Klebsormidium nitens]|uniref:Protein kinase-like protein containing BRO family, N-terminal domain n=1 Tax=Klebsormidium nitens TaxID=105231 RepID=A0A1Y1IT27_KLENI|nr:Protein kinase-like protein containing BRO family, N-terminal domain [Klebsormidium nitens]|eukprot:GAQ92461.1 Protein kinase-like protein containing BRO family, N-terminal domain [Klebsormidium nitens]